MIQPRASAVSDGGQIVTERLLVPWDGPGAAERARVFFETHGAFVARGLLPADLLGDVRRELSRLIDLAHRARGLERPDGEGFDAGFESLIAHAAETGDAIFGAARRLAAVHRLSVHPALLDLSAALMKTDMVMVPPYKPVRIDWAPRAFALLPWHQDYPYAQDSPDGVVYWVPLVDVDADNGCLEVALGSHGQGIRPVEMIEPEPDSPWPVRSLRLAEADAAEPCERVRLPMRADDVLVFSAQLLHRSHPNHTDRARWTVQIRHGNFAHPLSAAKGWPRGHFEGHWFDETHPEHVVAQAARSGDAEAQS